MTDRSISAPMRMQPSETSARLQRAALHLRRGQEARVRVDGPHRVVEVEGGHGVAQLQVGLEVRADRPHVLPVAAVEVGLHPHLADGVRDHVAAEVHERGVGHRLLERLAAEHVDPHRGEEAAAVARDVGLELGQAVRPSASPRSGRSAPDGSPSGCRSRRSRSAVTGRTATVASATCRRWVSSIFRKSIW